MLASGVLPLRAELILPSVLASGVLMLPSPSRLTTGPKLLLGKMTASVHRKQCQTGFREMPNATDPGFQLPQMACVESFE